MASLQFLRSHQWHALIISCLEKAVNVTRRNMTRGVFKAYVFFYMKSCHAFVLSPSKIV